MATASQIARVFSLPEIPHESDAEIASHWLLNHEHKEPTQRVKAALRRVTENDQIEQLLLHYNAQIRDEVLGLDLDNMAQLERIRNYFLFPAEYLSLTDLEFDQLERTINSVIKSKIKALAPLTQEQELFVLSLGLDTTEVTKLNKHTAVVNRIAEYAGVWNRTLLDEVDHQDELTRSELSKLRINEIFDIVIEYPSTIPALLDLKQCMDPTQRSVLINSFTRACTERLLHAGANTNDIILCYTSTIKSFLIIDPRGVLLDNASRPIRRYLRDREDTIPAIVNALLDNNPDDPLSKLADELAVETEKTVNNLTLDWHPDPIDALPDFRKQDIIESLISIFDSKEQFISELVDAFSRKLLAIKDFNISDSLLKLQQLKPKFEENELNNLDVMIRDIADSEDIDSFIHSKNSNLANNIRFSILSYMYWPELEDLEFKLPDSLTQQMESYAAEFKEVKKGRIIKCLKIGIVEVVLEFGDVKLQFDVSPDKAAVINCFDDESPTQNLMNICMKLEMDPATAKDALKYWVNAGILKSDADGYVVIEAQEPRSELMVDEDDTKDHDDEKFAGYAPYWAFITEMLSNLGPMEASKIHTFLTAVVPKKLGYTASAGELDEFLKYCVSRNQLDLVSGKYKLKD